MLPLYDTFDPQPVQGNLGLWYTRFFNRYDGEWKVPSEGKQRWIRDAVGHAEDFAKAPEGKSLLEARKARIEALVEDAGGTLRRFATTWRFVTGLGLPHPVENGFLWHPTLGVPYLPGTSVKGLLRAWIEAWAGLDDEPKEDLCRRWFGTTEQAGDLIFFDALPTEVPTLVPDIMTPHTGDWQAKGQDIRDPRSPADADKVPADWHSPMPVPFLVVRDTTFLFAIAPRHPRVAPVEVTHAFEHLENALLILGAGAKTAVGYGRLVPPEKKAQLLRLPPRPKVAAGGAIPDFQPGQLQGLNNAEKTRKVHEWAGLLQSHPDWTEAQKAEVAVHLRKMLRELHLWFSEERWDRRIRRKVEPWLPQEPES